jgi:hypothetical protein
VRPVGGEGKNESTNPSDYANANNLQQHQQKRQDRQKTTVTNQHQQKHQEQPAQKDSDHQNLLANRLRAVSHFLNLDILEEEIADLVELNPEEKTKWKTGWDSRINEIESKVGDHFGKKMKQKEVDNRISESLNEGELGIVKRELEGVRETCVAINERLTGAGRRRGSGVVGAIGEKAAEKSGLSSGLSSSSSGAEASGVGGLGKEDTLASGNETSTKSNNATTGITASPTLPEKLNALKQKIRATEEVKADAKEPDTAKLPSKPAPSIGKTAKPTATEDNLQILNSTIQNGLDLANSATIDLVSLDLSATLEDNSSNKFGCEGYDSRRLKEQSAETKQIKKKLRGMIVRVPDIDNLSEEDDEDEEEEDIYIEPTLLERLQECESFKEGCCDVGNSLLDSFVSCYDGLGKCLHGSFVVMVWLVLLSVFTQYFVKAMTG